MDELKACPFCGGNKLERWTVKELGYAVIECTDCHGKIVRDLDSDVITAWNRRTQPENKILSLETLLDRIHAIPEETFVGTYGDFDLVRSVKDSCCEAIEEFYAHKPGQEEK